MNFTEKRAQFMKLWISVRCDLPPEIQTTWIVSFIWKPEDFPETSTQENRFEVVPFKYHNLEFF